MTCIVVSRAGEGDAWRFADRRAARLHPLAQSYDLYAETADELHDSWPSGLVRGLIRLLPLGRRASMEADMDSLTHEEVRRVGREVWAALRESARTPPADPAELVDLIVRDRAAMEGIVIRAQRERKESNDVTTEKTAKKTKTEKVKAEGTGREMFRMHDEATIHFGKDEHGKHYGPEHSPKTGESTKSKWGSYRDGVTVKELLDGGLLTRSDIRRDRRAGFITIVNPPAAEPEAAAA